MSNLLGRVIIIGTLILIQPMILGAMNAGAPAGGFGITIEQARDLLSAAKSWGYQLQNVEPTVLAATPYDVLVIDYASNGHALTEQEIAELRHKRDGTRRIVLAYLSVGEAEDYRFYWNARWSTKPPSWLGPENADWPGNYHVRYWDRDWQGLIFGGPGAYLDRIIAEGFDGVYLDRVDAFDVPDAEMSRPARMTEMINFVRALEVYAHAAKPSLLILAQNGEELLDDKSYRDTLDGLGKEDLFFGIDGDGVPNARADVRASLTPIEAFLASGKPVFLVEYLTDRQQIETVQKSAAELGVPLFIADRELNHAQSR